jgi:hypothetical protein
MGGRNRETWGRTAASVVALTLALGCWCRGDEPALARVEAAFVYNFTQFIGWPADTFSDKDAPFVVAVVGEDPLAGALEQAMAGKVANGRPIVVRHFASPERVEGCQILFVPVTQDAAAPAILGKAANRPILTVGQTDAFMRSGGAVRLFVEDGRVKFQINPDVIDAAKIKASAKLMKLARVYRK